MEKKGVVRSGSSHGGTSAAATRRIIIGYESQCSGINGGVVVVIERKLGKKRREREREREEKNINKRGMDGEDLEGWLETMMSRRI